MASDSFKVKKSLNIEPIAGAAPTAEGDIAYDITAHKASLHNGTTASPVVTEAHASTLTNKSIDADTNTITNIENADIKAAAAIALNKLAAATVSRALVSDGSGFIVAATTTATEIGYVNGVTSAIQTQLNTNSTGLSDHLADAADAHAGSAITNTPSGNLAATTVQSALNELQTDVDTRATSTALTDHINDATDAHAGTSITNTPSGNLAATTVQAALNELQTDVDGRTSKATLTTTGDIYYASSANTPARLAIGSSGQLLKVTGGVPVWAAAPSGGINYIAPNQDAEVDTSGWSTYADAAGVSPVDGTGGSPNTTWTRSTSSPLRGTGSYLWTKASGASRQGEGVSFDFTIDSADQARPLSISFDYIIASGTFTASDGVTAPANSSTTVTAGNSTVAVFVYDVTNAVLIPVSPSVLTSNNTTTPASFRGIFQTASNSTSYRLILHTSYVTDAAMTAKFDNFYCGPQIQVQGAAVTDWTDYTLTIGATTTPPTLGTVTKTSAWRRVGDSMEIVFSYAQTATGSANQGSGSYLFPIPSGYTIDTTKITASTGGFQGIVGGATGAWASGGSTYTIHGDMVVYNSTNLAVQLEAQFNASTGAVNNANGFLQSGSLFIVTGANTSGSLTFTARVPIAGWSSTVQMSNDTDTRVVAASIGLTAAVTPATNAITIYDTKIQDTHSAYSTVTGLYTIPVSGTYRIALNTLTNAAANIYIQVNGVKKGVLFTAPAGSTVSGTLSYPFVAGDTVGIYNNNSGTFSATDGTLGFLNRLSIERLSGPATIAATETVAAASLSTPTSAAFNDSAYIKFPTMSFDTHASYSASTGLYTAPVSGIYDFGGKLGITGSSAGSYCDLSIFVNGTATYLFNPTSLITGEQFVSFSRLIKLVAGDTVGFRWNTDKSSAAISGGTLKNNLSIKRIG